MPRDMPGTDKARSVGRPAQGDNKDMKRKPAFSPKPQPGPPVVSTGTVTNPNSTGRWRPAPQAAPDIVQGTGPGV